MRGVTKNFARAFGSLLQILDTPLWTLPIEDELIINNDQYNNYFNTIDCVFPVFPCAAASQVRCFSGERCRPGDQFQQELTTPEGCCSSFPNILKTYNPTGSEECLRCGSCKFMNSISTTLLNRWRKQGGHQPPPFQNQAMLINTRLRP